MKRKLITTIALSTVLASSLFASETLDDIIITAKSNTSSLDTAGIFTIISQEDIQNSHASSVQDLIEESTGVSLATSGDGRKKVSIRGLDDTFTLILIDGKKVSNVDTQISYGDFAFEFISLDNIERIEIGKGPMSTLYGSGAIGGVINIITKKPSEELSGSINIEGGSSSGEGGSEQNISANINKKVTDNLYLGLGVSKKKTAIIANKDDDTDTMFEGRDIRNLSLDARYEFDDSQSLALSFLDSSDKRDTVAQENYYETDNNQYSLSYTKNFEKISLDIKAYRTETDSHTTFSNGFKHELVNDTLSAESKLDLIENNYIVLGLEAKKDSYLQKNDGSSTVVFDKEATQSAFFAQDDISLNDKTILTLGLRYDNHENYDSEFSPKAYLTYKLTKNSRLKGGYAEGFLAPTLSQGTDDYQAIRRPGGPSSLIFNGNDDLETQTGKTYELAYEYDDNNLSFKSVLFYNDIKNYIDSILISQVGFTSTYQYQNLDKVNTKGLELEISKKDILKDLDIFAGYTYLDTEDTDTKQELNKRPKHKINAKLSYLLPYQVKSSLKYELYGKQYKLADRYSGAKHLGSYSLVDFALSKRFSNDITVKTGVNNLFDKDIDSSNTGYGYQVRPRFYYVGLNYTF